jgi:hypothetical protein
MEFRFLYPSCGQKLKADVEHAKRKVDCPLCGVEFASLRARAAKESQLNRRVELNLEIKRLQAQLAEVARQL